MVYKTKLVDKQGVVKFNAEFDLWKNEVDLCCVRLVFGNEILLKKSFYYTHALDEIRELLEERNIFIACNGSRKDIITSGMISDISEGLAGNVLKRDGAILSEIINLFEYTEMYSMLVTVEEQKNIKAHLRILNGNYLW